MPIAPDGSEPRTPPRPCSQLTVGCARAQGVVTLGENPSGAAVLPVGSTGTVRSGPQPSRTTHCHSAGARPSFCCAPTLCTMCEGSVQQLTVYGDTWVGPVHRCLGHRPVVRAGLLHSHWREFCHFADALSPSLLKHLLKEEGGCSRMKFSPTALGLNLLRRLEPRRRQHAVLQRACGALHPARLVLDALLRHCRAWAGSTGPAAGPALGRPLGLRRCREVLHRGVPIRRRDCHST